MEFVLNQRQEDEMELSDQELEDADQPPHKRNKSDETAAASKTQVDDTKTDGDTNADKVRADELEKKLKHQESVITFLRTALNNTQQQLLTSKSQIEKLEDELKTLRTKTGQEDATTEKTTVADTTTVEKSETEPTEKTNQTEEKKTEETETIDLKTDQDKPESESTEKKVPEKRSLRGKKKLETPKKRSLRSQPKTPSDDKDEAPVTADEPKEKDDVVEESKDDVVEESTESVETESKETTAEAEDVVDQEKEAKKDSNEKTVDEETEEKPAEMSEMDRLIAEAMKYASESTSKPRENMKAVSDTELRIIGIVCTFLNVHPYGATVDYLCSYLNHLNIRMNVGQLEDILHRIPSLFYQGTRGVGPAMQQLWCFVGFNSKGTFDSPKDLN